MPMLLYVVGAVCVLAGAFFAWLGFPDREFSFGNTLILVGTIAGASGLILVGLGAVVSHLKQLIDTGAAQPATQPRRPAEAFEAAPSPRPPAGRIPFPPKPKLETRPPAVMPAELPPKAEPVSVAAPTLPNPDEPPVEVAEEVSLSPLQPPPRPTAEPDLPEEPIGEIEPREGFDKEWPAPAPAPERRSLFGFGRPERQPVEPPPRMAEPPPRMAEPPARMAEPPARMAEPPARMAEEPLPKIEEMPPEPEAPAAPPAPEPVAEPEPVAAEAASEKSRDVAILKSGVVDGMGYTLYVDGSIEAELPQGTLRFASINELREHLEQNT